MKHGHSFTRSAGVNTSGGGLSLRHHMKSRVFSKFPRRSDATPGKFPEIPFSRNLF
jgi:hypothetical protein